MRILGNQARRKESVLLTEACKFLKLAIQLQPEDFFLQKWIFLTDPVLRVHAQEGYPAFVPCLDYAATEEEQDCVRDALGCDCLRARPLDDPQFVLSFDQDFVAWRGTSPSAAQERTPDGPEGS